MISLASERQRERRGGREWWETVQEYERKREIIDDQSTHLCTVLPRRDPVTVIIGAF